MSNRIVGKIKSEIESLSERMGGTISPADLVEYARENPLSALHRCFQWDDAKAAEKWRLEQAGALLRRYTIKITNDGGETVRVRGLVSLPSDRGPEGIYRRTLQVLSESERVAELLATAKMELVAFRTKYFLLRKVAGMGPVFEAIDRALDS